MTSLLRLQQVSLGQRLVAVDANFEAGKSYHILGPNGAGKTSLLKVLSGVLSVTDGICWLNGSDIRQYPLADLARWRCFHQAGPASSFDLRVDELWRFFIPQFAHIPALIEQAFEVKALQHRSLLRLSSGESQRVHLARVLMQIWPAIEQGRGLVLLDEPLATLDIRHQLLCLSALDTLAAGGNTVVITSHDIRLSSQFAQQLVFLKQGRLITKGSPVEVLNKEVLSQVYDCESAVTEGTPPEVRFALFSS